MLRLRWAPAVSSSATCSLQTNISRYMQDRFLGCLECQCMRIILGVELSVRGLVQERAEQTTKQLQQVFGNLQRGVADGLTVLGSTLHTNAG